MPAKDLKEAIELLHYWQYGDYPDNFTSLLFTMMQKADLGNLAALKKGFPLEFEAWGAWMHAPSSEQFFAQHGLPDHRREEGSSS